MRDGERDRDRENRRCGGKKLTNYPDLRDMSFGNARVHWISIIVKIKHKKMKPHMKAHHRKIVDN